MTKIKQTGTNAAGIALYEITMTEMTEGKLMALTTATRNYSNHSEVCYDIFCSLRNAVATITLPPSLKQWMNDTFNK